MFFHSDFFDFTETNNFEDYFNNLHLLVKKLNDVDFLKQISS